MRKKKYKINSINDMNMNKKGIVMTFLLAAGLLLSLIHI